MVIAVIVRSLNEEKNIGRFCESYHWADKIIVADGGSLDDTIKIASSFDNVQVEIFNERIPLKNGHWRNPSDKHINYLIELAEIHNPDWILFDDCDCVPNNMLQEQARDILETTPFDFIYAVRVYLYGENKHFPKMAQPAKEGRWETSLWGWRASIPMQFSVEGGRGQVPSHKALPENRYNVYPPMALLHRPWATKEEVDRKLDFYRGSGQIPDMLHPLEFAGNPTQIEDWMEE